MVYRQASCWPFCCTLILCGIVMGLTSGLNCLKNCPLFVPGSPSEDGVSVRMIAAAETEIRKAIPTAIVVWGGGRRGDDQSMKAPGETDTWDFLAAAASESSASYWSMHYDGAWSIQPLSTQPMGIVLESMTGVSMDAVEAWSRVVQAGYEPPFRTWEVLHPLNPNVVNPIIVFNMPDGGYLIVDSVTGEVSQERDAWDCHQECREAYLNCCDECREHSPGDPDCYDGCDQARQECDNECG